MVLKEIAENYDGAEEFTNNRTDEICSQEEVLLKR